MLSTAPCMKAGSRQHPAQTDHFRRLGELKQTYVTDTVIRRFEFPEMF
jgi:hypothetical protein